MKITNKGFEPKSVTVGSDAPATLKVTRETDQTCAKSITVPKLKIKKDLPLIFIPRYRTPAYADLGVQGRYIDEGFLKGYEAELADVYSRLGYSVKWTLSDDTMASGGAIHCTTMQVAR